MGKVESIIKSEIVRLAKREIRRMAMPLRRDVRLLKSAAAQFRRSLLNLERSAKQRESERSQERMRLHATPEEVEVSRFSPRLILALRKRLGITQRELATLAGVTVGARGFP